MAVTWGSQRKKVTIATINDMNALFPIIIFISPFLKLKLGSLAEATYPYNDNGAFSFPKKRPPGRFPYREHGPSWPL
jgi:hypothetical protein